MRSNPARNVLAKREVGAALLLVLVMVVAGMRAHRFLEPASLESILLWVPLLLVVGLGEMAVIVTRGIDVSVGSMVGLSAMSAGMLLRAHPQWNLGIDVAAGIGAGLILGSINGVLIAFAKVPPIITTLGAMSAYRGLIFLLSHGEQVDSNYIPTALTGWSSTGPIQIGGVVLPWTLVIALVVAGAAAWFLRFTRTGRDLFAYGSNPEAARLRGVPVRRISFLVYLVTGGLCGLAGVLYASQFGFVNPASAGQGMELVVIAAVVIGGTNIVGGSGSVLGVLLGCFVLGAINVALAVLGIDETWQQLVYGTVILVAVLLDAIVRRTADGAKALKGRASA